MFFKLVKMTSMKLKNQRIVLKMTLLGFSLALFVVLNYASFNLQFIKFSVKGLPIIFISVVYGPLEGVLVAAFGEFFCQLVSPYGLTPTTPLWLLPWIAQALIVGFMFKQKNVKTHLVRWIITVVLCCIAVTGLNTLAIYLDALVWHYPHLLTQINIILRFVNSLVSAVVYILVVPFLFQPLIKQGKFDIEKD